MILACSVTSDYFSLLQLCYNFGHQKMGWCHDNYVSFQPLQLHISRGVYLKTLFISSGILKFVCFKAGLPSSLQGSSPYSMDRLISSCPDHKSVPSWAHFCWHLWAQIITVITIGILLDLTRPGVDSLGVGILPSPGDETPHWLPT